MISSHPVSPAHAEETVAARVSAERLRREWSYGDVATRMTEAGVTMQASTVYKIETRKRRTTLSDLVGFAHVFGISLEGLMTPLDLDESIRAQQIVSDMQFPWDQLVDHALTLSRRYAKLGELPQDAQFDPRELLMRDDRPGIAWARKQADLAPMVPVYDALEDVLMALARVHLGGDAGGGEHREAP